VKYIRKCLLESGIDLGVRLSGVVIGNQIGCQVLGGCRVDLLEQGQPLRHGYTCSVGALGFGDGNRLIIGQAG